MDTKMSNLTIDMAQSMADVSKLSTDVEMLQKEVTLVKARLTQLAGAVDLLRASGDRLDNHLSKYLESFEKRKNTDRKPLLYLIVLVLVLDLVLEVFLLLEFLKV